MSQPNWKEVTDVGGAHFTVPRIAGMLWTKIVDYLPAGRLIKIEAEGNWTLDGVNTPCEPDGDFSLYELPGLPIARAARGALIGRIGGSSADLAAVDNSMHLFVVGRVCVLQVPADKTGSLYLSVNDKPWPASRVQGQLKVRVFESI